MSERMKGILLIVISAFGYGVMPSISTLAYGLGYTVSQVLFYRFFLSALMIWGVIGFYKVPIKMSFKHGVYLALIGFLGYTLCSKVLFIGYQYVSGSVATMILFTHPIFVVLGESAFAKQWPSKFKIGAMGLTVIGLLVILFDPSAQMNTYGVLMCFLSSVTYAIYCLGLAEPKTRQLHTFVVTAFVVTLSAIYNLIECIQTGTAITQIEPKGLMLLSILALLGTVIPAITFFEGLKYVGSGSATIISTVEPAFVYLFEVLILGQSLVFKNVIGGLIIAVGILLINGESSEKSIKVDPNNT